LNAGNIWGEKGDYDTGTLIIHRRNVTTGMLGDLHISIDGREMGRLSFFMSGADGAGLHCGADRVQMMDHNMENIEYLDHKRCKSSTISTI
jgi:hypothetical protein